MIRFSEILMRFFEPVSVTIWGEFFREISIDKKPSRKTGIANDNIDQLRDLKKIFLKVVKT